MDDLDKAKELLRIAMQNGYHSATCSKTIDRKKDCSCWVKDAESFLKPAAKPIPLPNSILKRWDDSENCNDCRHKALYHTARFANGDMACAKVDCTCLKLITDTEVKPVEKEAKPIEAEATAIKS